jgi:hypothetical protein
VKDVINSDNIIVPVVKMVDTNYSYHEKKGEPQKTYIKIVMKLKMC